MRVAATFLQPPPVSTKGKSPHRLVSGVPSLMHICISTILETIAGRVGHPEYDAADMAEAMLLASRELDIGLRGKTLAQSAALVANHPARLSDSAIRVLLHYEGKEQDASLVSDRPLSRSEGAEDVREEDDALDGQDAEEWELDDNPVSTMSHLSLTTHPAPLRLLQDVPRMRALSLMSVDLSFATLPALDKVVNALPARLRALGLTGVRSAEGYSSWTRGMGSLARKMTVLQVC